MNDVLTWQFFTACVLGAFIISYLLTEWYYEERFRKEQLKKYRLYKEIQILDGKLTEEREHNAALRSENDYLVTRENDRQFDESVQLGNL
jgi:hypothetical protein